MKDFWKVTGFALFWVMWGVIFTCCITRCWRSSGNESVTIVERCDTVVERDTVTIVEPAPVSVANRGTIKKILPVAVHDTIRVYASADSIEVEIPIVQKEYADSTYHVWISGYEPRLDSLKIVNMTEYITIERTERARQKRWHIGPSVGVGYTMKGFQPVAGVSLTYAILSF